MEADELKNYLVTPAHLPETNGLIDCVTELEFAFDCAIASQENEKKKHCQPG